MTELYFSCDVEADGPIPLVHSMMSLGCAAFSEDGTMVGTFSENLLPPDSPEYKGMDPSTKAFWDQHPEAYSASTLGARDPAAVMKQFVEWVEGLAKQHNAKPVFVGYPALYDGMFVYMYMIYYVGRSPFSHSGLDMKTLASELLGVPYRSISKGLLHKQFPIPSEYKHSHTGIDDAIEQGALFIEMLRFSRRKRASENPSL